MCFCGRNVNSKYCTWVIKKKNYNVDTLKTLLMARVRAFATTMILPIINIYPHCYYCSHTFDFCESLIARRTPLARRHVPVDKIAYLYRIYTAVMSATVLIHTYEFIVRQTTSFRIIHIYIYIVIHNDNNNTYTHIHWPTHTNTHTRKHVRYTLYYIYYIHIRCTYYTRGRDYVCRARPIIASREHRARR